MNPIVLSMSTTDVDGLEPSGLDEFSQCAAVDLQLISGLPFCQ
jgi:hypothetical protein